MVSWETQSTTLQRVTDNFQAGNSIESKTLTVTSLITLAKLIPLDQFLALALFSLIQTATT
jgi:hypothetical protein